MAPASWQYKSNGVAPLFSTRKLVADIRDRALLATNTMNSLLRNRVFALTTHGAFALTTRGVFALTTRGVL